MDVQNSLSGSLLPYLVVVRVAQRMRSRKSADNNNNEKGYRYTMYASSLLITYMFVQHTLGKPVKNNKAQL